MSEELTQDDFDKLYIVSRLVFEGKITPDKAMFKLADIIPATPEQIKITFAMYIGMRHGRTFHHSLSDDIIIYFLKRIADEEGVDGLKLALDATYGYAGFKYSIGSELPELEAACDDLRTKFGLHQPPEDA